MGVIGVAVETEVVLMRLFLSTEVARDSNRVLVQKNLVGTCVMPVLVHPDLIFVLHDIAVVARSNRAVAFTTVVARHPFMFILSGLGNQRGFRCGRRGPQEPNLTRLRKIRVRLRRTLGERGLPVG